MQSAKFDSQQRLRITRGVVILGMDIPQINHGPDEQSKEVFAVHYDVLRARGMLLLVTYMLSLFEHRLI